jgi:hypothetical protein
VISGWCHEVDAVRFYLYDTQLLLQRKRGLRADFNRRTTVPNVLNWIGMGVSFHRNPQLSVVRIFMKYHTPFLTAALVASLIAGCSKSSSVVATPSVTYTNLGVLEVSDGIPIRHALGDGRAYILTPTVLKDGRIELRLDLQVTNSSGGVEMRLGPTDCVLPGQEARFSVDDVGVYVVPKAKG